MLTTVKKYSLQQVISSLQVGFGFPTQRKFERKETVREGIFPPLLTLFFILNLSFLSYAVNTTFGILFENKGFLYQISFFAGLILLIFLVKAVINGILTFVTSKAKFIQEYKNVSGSMNRATGLFLFPLLLLLGFSEIDTKAIVIISLVMLGALLLVKWIRGIVLSLGEEGLGILQILTYFCALEILPQLVLLKYTIETFKAG